MKGTCRTNEHRTNGEIVTKLRHSPCFNDINNAADISEYAVRVVTRLYIKHAARISRQLRWKIPRCHKQTLRGPALIIDCVALQQLPGTLGSVVPLPLSPPIITTRLTIITVINNYSWQLVVNLTTNCQPIAAEIE